MISLNTQIDLQNQLCYEETWYVFEQFLHCYNLATRLNLEIITSSLYPNSQLEHITLEGSAEQFQPEWPGMVFCSRPTTIVQQCSFDSQEEVFNNSTSLP
jgi:hypothetical protein